MSGEQQPAPPAAERLDISGRDIATLEPIELLAWAYPEVYALMRERDAAVAAAGRLRAELDRLRQGADS